MAKKSRRTKKVLPPPTITTLEAAEPATALATAPPPKKPPAEPKPKPKTDKLSRTRVSVTVPKVEPTVGYVSNVCHIKNMSQKQRVTLRHITNGLIDEKAILENGTIVKTGSHAVLWMLEKLSE